MDKNKTYGVVAAVIVIIIIIAVVAWYVTSNDDNGSDTPTDEGDTYYFYLDGFSDEIDGWYDANGNDVISSFDSAMDEAGIVYEYNGWALTIEDYVSDYDYNADTGVTVGTGYGIFAYGSTDLSMYNNMYFFAGPALDDITSNVIYISYGEYTMAADGSSDYVVNPSENTELGTTGPFAQNSGYEPLAYDGEFYFYLDGFSDEIDGWYNGTGDDIMVALDVAMDEAGIAYEYNGWALTIEDYVSDYDYNADTGVTVGTGYGIFEFMSSDVSSYWNYFFAGPAIDDVASNIVYISYGDYTMDADGSSDYIVNPSENTELETTGPFATA